MLIEEIFNHILIRSGNFLLGKNQIELKKNNFSDLIKAALGKYDRYRPIDKTFHLSLQSVRSFEFKDTFTVDGVVFGIPEQISDVTPTNVLGAHIFNPLNPIGALESSFESGLIPGDPSFELPGQMQVMSDIEEKGKFPIIYRKPKLFIPYSSDIEVIGIFFHKIIKTVADKNKEIEFDVPNIDFTNDDTFFDILEGMFLKAVGKSRRAFTISDLPIIFDAAEMVSDGEAILETSLEDLRTNKSKFYLAY